MVLSWFLFLSFSSHVSCYANKALKIAQNLHIMGHCYGGIDPQLRWQTYYAVCRPVMTYGLALWYRLKGKGIKYLVSWLNKAQNVVLCWLMGTFCTTLVVLLEFFSSIAPVRVQLDFQLRNFMARVSTVPSSHPLHKLATSLVRSE